MRGVVERRGVEGGTGGGDMETAGGCGQKAAIRQDVAARRPGATGGGFRSRRLVTACEWTRLPSRKRATVLPSKVMARWCHLPSQADDVERISGGRCRCRCTAPSDR